MPEIRKNRITGEFVVMAPERAKRPHEFYAAQTAEPLPEHSNACPLCPGNERMTPPETYRRPETGPWSVRCVPNKYSALSPEGEVWWKVEGLKTCMSGIGLHEVLVESPLHNTCLARMADRQVREVVHAYHSKFREFHKDPRIEQVILFKNHGQQAGTSLQHPHSQIIGIPLVPAQVRSRAEEAMRYYMDNGKCLYCAVMEDELSDGKRVVIETASYVVFIPFAALSPFHTWIFPKRHSGCFGDATKKELDELAVVLKTVLAKLYKGLGNPDYNFSIRTAPPADTTARHLHWYMAVIPRLTRVAGFELGTGMYINPSLPEDSAEFMRGV